MCLWRQSPLRSLPSQNDTLQFCDPDVIWTHKFWSGLRSEVSCLFELQHRATQCWARGREHHTTSAGHAGNWSSLARSGILKSDRAQHEDAQKLNRFYSSDDCDRICRTVPDSAVCAHACTSDWFSITLIAVCMPTDATMVYVGPSMENLNVAHSTFGCLNGELHHTTPDHVRYCLLHIYLRVLHKPPGSHAQARCHLWCSFERIKTFDVSVVLASQGLICWPSIHLRRE